MSIATIHESLVNAGAARLYDPESKLPIKRNLLEFLICGVKYCFPAERGPMTRGVPTSYAASPLVSHFPPGKDPIPVWPYPGGTARGIELQPIHQVVPYIALADHRFGEIMALVDAVREGRPREVSLAVEELKKRFV